MIHLNENNELWIASWDLPATPAAPRLKFYRRLAKIRKQHGFEFESQSVVISTDAEAIQHIFELAKSFGATAGGVHRITGLFETINEIVAQQ